MILGPLCTCAIVDTDLIGKAGVVGGNAVHEEVWLKRAIELAVDNAAAGGRPFGAVIALDGETVGEGVNRCVVDNDPTAHAEVMAIRAATRQLATSRLDGAVLAASTEPCPMCQAAALLAGVARVIFATTDREAAERGYDAREALADLRRPFAARRVMAVRHLAVDGESLPYEVAAARTPIKPSKLPGRFGGSDTSAPVE